MLIAPHTYTVPATICARIAPATTTSPWSSRSARLEQEACCCCCLD